MKINTRMITPAMAAKFLHANTNNRPLSDRHVQTLADAMKRGEWQTTGESIKLAKGGRLLDGQHRLHAIIKSGITIKILVVEDLEDEAFHVIDTGSRNRSTADILAISGEQNPRILSAAAAIIAAWEIDPDLTKRTQVFTVPQLEAVIKRHPTLRNYTDVHPKLKKVIPASLAAALSYLFSLVDIETTERFMERLSTGVGLDKNHPILLLRDILINNKSARAKFNNKVIAALVIRAFNAYHEDRTITTLRWRNGEAFPTISGLNRK